MFVGRLLTSSSECRYYVVVRTSLTETTLTRRDIFLSGQGEGVSPMGTAGFCWGAKVVVELGKSDQYIQAGVMMHPARVTVDNIKVCLSAEHDWVSPPELLKQFKEVLSNKPEVDVYVKICPRVVHGWAVRYKDDDEVAVKGAQEAQKDMHEWFSKHLK